MRFINEKNQSILSEMVRTNFKVRYQGSLLGYLWSLLKPMATFSIMFVIFTIIWPVARDVEYYAVYLLLGVVLWNFFTETTIIGSTSIVANGALIRKINIPRWLIVVSSSFSALINLGLSLIVVFIFAFIMRVPISWHILTLIPIIIELFIFSLGIAFLLSTLYVKFRDISYIWEIILQAGFYCSAIFFPLLSVSEGMRKFFFINPMVQIIQDARYSLIPSPNVVTLWNVGASWRLMIIPFVILICITVFGARLFKTQSRYFAEDI